MADADRDSTLWAGITSVLPMAIILTPFARTRLFPSEPRGNTIQGCTPGQFEQRLNEEAPLKVLDGYAPFCKLHVHRSEEHTSELQSLMRISYAVFCLNKTTNNNTCTGPSVYTTSYSLTI